MKNNVVFLLVFFMLSCSQKSEKTPTQLTSLVDDVDTVAEITPSVELGEQVCGNQIWAIKFLNVSTFKNGDTIMEAKSNSQWELAYRLGKPAWCYYDNNRKNGEKYGKLYNIFAVKDARGISPDGWHIPDDNELATLIDYLNASNDKLKCVSAGQRETNSQFKGLGEFANFWSSDDNKAGGKSILCIKDEPAINSEVQNQSSNDNSWLIGAWEVQTDVGLMNLTIIDSQNATFLDDMGTYSIDNGILKWRDKQGSVSPFTINYLNETLNVDGSNYVLRKID